VPGVCLADHLQLGEATIEGAWSHRAPGLCVPTHRGTNPLSAYRGRDGQTVVYTHRDCPCNELLALRNRHQVGMPSDPAAISLLHAECVRLLAKLDRVCLPERRDTFGEVLRHRTGGKRRKWERAIRSVQTMGLHSKHSKVQMFLKADKYVSPVEGKAPRCIQFRTNEYCVSLARYLYPVERRLWQFRDSRGLSVFAKSRNTWQRAQDLRQHFDSFASPVALLLDHSKWDAHVSTGLLDVEHYFYQRHYEGDGRLARLLRWQHVNRGKSRIGTRYFTPATRMSGDMNTALGNSLLNYLILRSWLRASGVQGTVYCDGDDSVVMVEHRDEHRLQPVAQFMASVGMETKVDRADEFERVEFCQSRPVEVSGHWRMVRNPERVLNRSGWVTYPVTSQRHASRLLFSVGTCELAMNSGVPLLQSFSLLLRAAGKGPVWREHELVARARLDCPLWRVRPRPVDMSTRLSLEAAWGLTVAEQTKLETTIRIRPSRAQRPIDVEALGCWAE
jgi:hypothetical protein